MIYGSTSGDHSKIVSIYQLFMFLVVYLSFICIFIVAMFQKDSLLTDVVKRQRLFIRIRKITIILFRAYF